MSVRIFASRTTNVGRTLLFKRSYVSVTADQVSKQGRVQEFRFDIDAYRCDIEYSYLLIPIESAAEEDMFV